MRMHAKVEWGYVVRQLQGICVGFRSSKGTCALERPIVVAGAAHVGGAKGVLAFLRHRGYRIEHFNSPLPHLSPFCDITGLDQLRAFPRMRSTISRTPQHHGADQNNRRPSRIAQTMRDLTKGN